MGSSDAASESHPRIHVDISIAIIAAETAGLIVSGLGGIGPHARPNLRRDRRGRRPRRADAIQEVGPTAPVGLASPAGVGRRVPPGGDLGSVDGIVSRDYIGHGHGDHSSRE